MADPDTYNAGFYDAADLTPLFPDAHPDYRAGWLAYWEAREIVSNLENDND